MSKALPQELEQVRISAQKALGDLHPAGSPKSEDEPKALLMSSRTNAGRSLPSYYLVYFLLVDLLKFPHMGKWEKTAWTVPVRLRGRLYGIEHRKMGLGVFAPSLDPNTNRSGSPTAEQETDAEEITSVIVKAVEAAKEYFEWRAKEAVLGSELNVVNRSSYLFDRYEYFLHQYKALAKEAKERSGERLTTKTILDDGSEINTTTFPGYTLRLESEWCAQSAIEAFFSWTEHVFIHLAILQGNLSTGIDVSNLATAEWKHKFKAVMDLNNKTTKVHYDNLLDLRAQIRNFMAHGSFGKRGEAFSFHSGAGAVPVLLTENERHRYALSGKPAFDEKWAIDEIEEFIAHMWSGVCGPSKPYIFSELPSILTYARDGTYARAMVDDESMKEFVEYLTMQSDNAANMDW